jgi:translation initiation factor 2D
MFHKESSSNIQAGGGRGGGEVGGIATSRKHQKVLDIPLKKSDRKRLLDRAQRYFVGVSDGIDKKEEESSLPQWLGNILETALLQGQLAVRSIAVPQHQYCKMMLYLKAPHPADEGLSSVGSSSITTLSVTTTWPYTASSQFVWMALEEKGGKVLAEGPTVALWSVLVAQCPPPPSTDSVLRLTDRCIVVHSAVSHYICKGADLMRAGMRSRPTLLPFRGSTTNTITTHTTSKTNINNNNNNMGGIVPIVVQGNPQPFAVGLLVVNPNDPIGTGTKGIGVQIWNSYGDDLWKTTCNSTPTPNGTAGSGYWNPTGGASFEDGNYGNVGFQNGKRVLPIVNREDDSDDEEEDGEEEDDDESGNHDDPSTTIHGASDGTSDTLANEEEPPPNDEQQDTEEVSSSVSSSLSPDEILHQAVLRGLLTVPKKDLPMVMTSFYSNHVLPNRLPDTTIDMKATTYKKFGNYLKEQIQRGLLKAGPDVSNKKNMDPMASLLSFDKGHEDFKGIEKPEISKKAIGPTKSVLVSLYTIPNHWVSLLRLDDDDVKAVNATSEARRGTGMLTGVEIKTLLEAYIAKESLVLPDRPAQVQLDGGLTQALFKGQADPPQILARQDLVKTFQSKLGTAYALVSMPGSHIVKLARGDPPPIEIEVSLRQSKKFVTRVRGVEDYGIDASIFAKDVAKRLACAAAVEMEAAAGRPALKKGKAECVFQGNIVTELEALLLGDESLSTHGGVKDSQYSVPKQALSITLRKGVPARKRR